MTDRPDEHDEDEGDVEGEKSYTAEGVRQGAVVLRSRQRRTIFIAGLVGVVVLILLFAVF